MLQFIYPYYNSNHTTELLIRDNIKTAGKKFSKIPENAYFWNAVGWKDIYGGR